MRHRPTALSRRPAKPSAAHRAEYERRVLKALAHIDQHLDEPLDLERLARVAAFSPFHLHRIFAAHLGETFGSYLTRRRLEQAAARLAAQPRLSVLAAALAVGFGSAEAFARAFKKHFHCTPSEWKRRPLPPAARKSKISQTKSSLNQAKHPPKAYGAAMNSTPTLPLHVALKSRPAIRIATLRYQGAFGAPLGRFWQEKVYPWLAANGLLDRARYGISQDDPSVTAKNKCRYDAGVEVDADFVPSPHVQVCTLPAGLYACTHFKGRSEEVPAAWQRILREWLPASGYQLDARPCFEHYPLDGEYDPKTGAFTCELCTPIAKL